MTENKTEQSLFPCQLLAVLYRGKKGKIDQIVPFIKTALDREQKCLYWFIDPRERDYLEEAFKRLDIALDPHLLSGQLRFFPAAEFEVKDPVPPLRIEAVRGDDKGYSSQLLIADCGSYLKTPAGREVLLDFHRRLESLRLPIATRICCLYNLATVPPQHLRNILNRYPLIHHRHSTYHNYGYFPLQEAESSEARARAELDVFLENLEQWDRLEVLQGGRPDYQADYLSELLEKAGLSVIFTDI